MNRHIKFVNKNNQIISGTNFLVTKYENNRNFIILGRDLSSNLEYRAEFPVSKDLKNLKFDKGIGLYIEDETKKLLFKTESTINESKFKITINDFLNSNDIEIIAENIENSKVFKMLYNWDKNTSLQDLVKTLTVINDKLTFYTDQDLQNIAKIQKIFRKKKRIKNIKKPKSSNEILVKNE